MKKHILAIILCVLCVSLVLVFASCGDTNTSTDCSQGHSFGDWTTETYASCTSAGLKVRVCQNCSYEEEEPIPSGHKWGEWEVVKELTCEQNGVDQRICSVCDFVEEEEFATEGHKWSEWEITSVGTCNDDSISERECSACGKKEEETVPGDGHNFSEWGTDLVGDPFVKNATCEETGYIGRECIDCGEQEFQTTDALGHNWGTWDVVGSCATGATKTRVCSVCNEDETETTAAGEHANIVFEGAKEATRDEDGSTGTKKCLACGTMLEGAKIIRIVNVALGSEVTTTSAFWASNDSYVGKIVDGNRESGVCSSPKVTSISDTIKFSTPTNVEKVILVVNGKGSTTDGAKYDEVTNNDYNIAFVICDADGNLIYSSQTYKTLDQVEIVEEVTLPEGKLAGSIIVKRMNSPYVTNNHLWEVEVLNTLYLSPCDADGHNWGEGWKTVTPAECSPTSLKDGLETRTCSVCGTTEQNVILAKHTWTEWDMSGITCAGGGTKSRECRACGKVVTETIPAGGHLNVELQGAKEATLEEAGYTGDYKCTACGTVVEAGKEIPKLVNALLGATVTTTTTHWHVTGQSNGNGLAPLVDGNKATGVASDPSNPTNILIVELAEANADIFKFIFVVNGSGYCPGPYMSKEDTNNSYELSFVLYDEDGNVIYTSEKYQTLDQTEIEVNVDLGGKAVKKIEIKRFKQDYTSNNVIWEAIAVATGKAAE